MEKMDDFEDFSNEGPRHRRPQEHYDRDISFHTPARTSQFSQYTLQPQDTSSHFYARGGNLSRQVYDDDQLTYEEGQIAGPNWFSPSLSRSTALDDYGPSESLLLPNTMY